MKFWQKICKNKKGKKGGGRVRGLSVKFSKITVKLRLHALNTICPPVLNIFVDIFLVSEVGSWSPTFSSIPVPMQRDGLSRTLAKFGQLCLLHHHSLCSHNCLIITNPLVLLLFSFEDLWFVISTCGCHLTSPNLPYATLLDLLKWRQYVAQWHCRVHTNVIRCVEIIPLHFWDWRGQRLVQNQAWLTESTRSGGLSL